MYTDKADIDVSQIAVKHGGGGHKGAAGFQPSEYTDIIDFFDKN